ncbi:hypothetical protein C8035_v003845 [Colletotrichum spinosum]|uniref:Uncharacterized protein n=1 Tax=Colletotrichum spinosum TaxID=1347390 RepID=A0A4R8PX78_9PEZI|nr:hypothetical protein C8035_v003845 [Colletotrichum spinosum]
MASSTSHTPNTVTVFTTRHVFGSSTETKTSHSSSSVYTRFDGSVEVKVTVVLYITEVFPYNCTRYLTGRTIEYPNPDISGRGVTIAFLASAYLVLATILVAYWLGALPDGLVREVDHRLLFARRKRLGKAWTAFFEEVVLVFSDQQLITGLAILVAGYVQLLGANLSAYHWNSVIYLAWLSSTVHLMSLSVLRTRLRRSLVLRTIRLGVMLLLLVLLLVALIPTTKDSWAAIGLYTSTLDPGVPARCLFGDALASAPLEQEIMDRDSWISYLSLLGGFAWKATQLFDRPRSWLRHWGRARVECFLERRARAVTRRRQSRTRRAKFAFIAIIYVVFVASMEFLESFFFTIYVLGLALGWGSYKLLVFREFEVGPDVRAAESELGFGQILPLLLLVQPAFTAVDIYFQYISLADSANDNDANQNTNANAISGQSFILVTGKFARHIFE